MAERQPSRRSRLLDAWAEGLTRVGITAAEHFGVVVTLLLFGALEWLRSRAPVHLEGASARAANLVLLFGEGVTLLRGLSLSVLEAAGEIGEATGRTWHRIRKGWRSGGNRQRRRRV